MEPSDLDLASRVRLLVPKAGIVEKKMFGGTCFLLNGNLLCGASGRGLMIRVGRENHEAALALEGARAMVLNRKVFHGYMRLDPQYVRDEGQLKAWMKRGLAYVSTLPAKPVKPPRPKKSIDDGIPRHPASYAKAPAKKAPAKR